MDQTGIILARANEIYARANSTTTSSTTTKERPPVYKAIGIALAISSGVFIGTSFVLKKTGLLKANVKYNEEAGEGYGYLKNAYWWSGMTLMIIGEICNFVAYAFVDAILVTPLGALSVVITTILSAIFLKERLSFVGKVGCFMCIIGSVVIVMNAPAQSSAGTIQEMKHFVLAPGFLSYAGVIIVACLFIALWVGPRYGKKSMLVYLSICSLIGGLSVVATQGLGAAIVTQAGGTPQFNQWFLYLLLVFVITTLVTEIIFLNKALNLFNAALVTPTYYVFFTSSTIVTSAILFQGFKGTPTSIITVVLGFLQICSGVILLQLSKSAKDVPDAAVFKGDLDQVRTVAEQEEPESEPKADAIRGAAAILRRFSQSRQKTEAAEAKRIHEDRLKDQMEPIGEDEQVEWDGLRRRKTVLNGPQGSLRRQKTVHPPLGMARFPDEEEDHEPRPRTTDIMGSGGGAFNGGFMDSFRRGSSGRFKARKGKSLSTGAPELTGHPTALNTSSEPAAAQVLGAMEMDHVYGLPSGLRGTDGDGEVDTEYHGKSDKHILLAEEIRPVASRGSSLAPTPPPHAKRQFSFSNVFNRHKHDAPSSSDITHEHHRPLSRLGVGSRQGSKEHNIPGLKTATEEERLGLVKGDSTNILTLPDYSENSDEDDWQLEGKPGASHTTTTTTGHVPLIREEEKESNDDRPDVPNKNTPRLGQR
ncbi:MAG: hypothetical protein ASARMPRED_008549 [Alectoria sarmentosa]|nr:MAG: hypothetical protein ASARMPRED_008549 [Alectoria sarmentosa]